MKLYTFFAISILFFSSFLVVAEEFYLPKWMELTGKAERAVLQEDYDEALKWAEKSYDYARRYFSDDYQKILTTSANIKTGVLSMITVKYYQQGDSQKSLVFAQQNYEFINQHFGSKNEFAPASVSLLASAHAAQGDYKEAEYWSKMALSLSEEILGTEHPNNVYIHNNLATLYATLGDYGNAEFYYKKAYSLGQKINYDRLYLWTLLNQLGGLYLIQDRYQEAKATYQEASALSKQIPRDAHIFRPGIPDAPNLPIKKTVEAAQSFNRLETLRGLAAVSKYQHAYGDAMEKLDQALALSEHKWGPKHPNTIETLDDMAALYAFQERYDKALPLFEKTQSLQQEVLGAEHPLTLQTLLIIAELHYYKGHYQTAVSLYEHTLPRLAKQLGYEHPTIRNAYLNYASGLVNLGHHEKSVALLKMIEPIQLFYATGQFYTTEKERVRRTLFTDLAGSFQNVVFSLAHRYPADDNLRRFAANVLLRWKQRQAEEEAVIAKLMHNAENQQIADLSHQIKQQRANLSHQIYQVDKTKGLSFLSHLSEQLEATELALAQATRTYQAHLQIVENQKKRLQQTESQLADLSSDYQAHLKAMAIDIEQIRAKLPQNGALIEFRASQPVDFSQGKRSGELLHWMALLLTQDTIVLKDLGFVVTTKAIWEKLTQQGLKAEAGELYQNLFGVFDEQIKGLDTIYIAPDGFLNLIPFSRLVLPDGRYWIERQTLRQIQTGRDLLRDKPTPASDWLLAIGGVDFEEYPEQSLRDHSTQTAKIHRGLVEGHEYFIELPAASREEVQDIAAIYPGNSATWKGITASEGRLKGLQQVPRVLHFATHAFYIDKPTTEVDTIRRPLTLSGLALAGANLGLEGELDPDQEDGILYGLEALNLNLNGTELVVFSACETGQGVVDYSEGVYGLVRAFKIAGAYRILMTLWPVYNEDSKDFMVKFYQNWLKQQDDPAKALQITQLEYIKHSTQLLRDPEVWAAYAVVGP